ncbi:MAG: hypothetical protein BWY62_00693 [Firmicutes bacterium ADurb.Bin356]|nr:MAG: hypothetical protein BWY62_00693 [Firmicutes bacterium ADurb.Bin356]
MSSVRVPVLSVHSTFISPNTWIAPRVRTITWCLDIVSAPLAKVEVIITGSISGVRPTATLTENSSALGQLPFASTFIRNTTGTITNIMRRRRLLIESTPRSKLVFALSPESDFAIEPK